MGLHLAIDAAGAKHGGAASVLLDTLGAALADPRIERVTLFGAPTQALRFCLPRSHRLAVVGSRLVEEGRLARLLWFSGGLAAAVKSIDAGLLLCLSGGGFPPAGVPGGTLIQQSLPFAPEALACCDLGTRLRMQVLRATMEQSSRRSARVFVQTPTMARWVGDAFGIRPAVLEVVRPAAPSLPSSAAPAAELQRMRDVGPDRRLLYVGNASPYKNTAVLLAAMARVRIALPGATLFVTSPLRPTAGVVSLGYLSRPVLHEAYRLATALVMPSLVETVGLPLIEAMSLGTAVVAADRPYARDVCGEAASYFEPTDLSGLERTLLRVLASSDERDRRRAAGYEVAARWSAERGYSRMIDAIVKLAR